MKELRHLQKPVNQLYRFCCKRQKWERHNPATRSAWFCYTWIL